MIRLSHLRPGGGRPPKRHLTRLLAALILILASAAHAQTSMPLRVLVTINPYADLIERVAGGRATVTTLLPPGASPHAFDPTPSQAAQLANADLIIMNGGLDMWLSRLIDATAPNTPVLVLMDAIDFVALESHEHHAQPQDSAHEHEGEHNEYGDTALHADAHHHDHQGNTEHDTGSAAAAFANPHIWLDPLLAAEAVSAISLTLAHLDPDWADEYAANAQRTRQELEELHAHLTQLLAPVSGAAFVPFHDAWVYFAARYDLHIVVTLEPFPGREPSPRYIAEAVQAVRTSGAKAIFAERQLGSRSAEVVAQSAQVLVAVLDPLGGQPGPTTYEDLLVQNAATIVAALKD